MNLNVNKNKNLKNLKEWEKRFYSWDEIDIKHPKKWIKEYNINEFEKSKIFRINTSFNGIIISTSSYVGSIKLGNVIFQVKPKILDLKFMKLINYAFNLDNLNLSHSSLYEVNQDGFLELLLIQLIYQIERILKIGLYRGYIEVKENLKSPKGKIDFKTYNRKLFNLKDSIPCFYYKRIENNLLNQILLAGMQEGAFRTNNLRIRYSLLNIVKLFSESVNSIKLTPNIFKKAEQKINRLTDYYRPPLDLIKIMNLPPDFLKDDINKNFLFQGYFFDMNIFFQKLLLRFFIDTLGNKQVKSEGLIKNIYSYLSNPYKRKDPNLRPDYIILDKEGKAIILDAKYRDLSEKVLPSKWLYQL
ncbi:MAG: 5-methylcytosine restriction system specificity protein McrC, partial [Candidatus Helarchaeota archaeon]